MTSLSVQTRDSHFEKSVGRHIRLFGNEVCLGRGGESSIFSWKFNSILRLALLVDAMCMFKELDMVGF